MSLKISTEKDRLEDVGDLIDTFNKSEHSLSSVDSSLSQLSLLTPAPALNLSRRTSQLSQGVIPYDKDEYENVKGKKVLKGRSWNPETSGISGPSGWTYTIGFYRPVDNFVAHRAELRSQGRHADVKLAHGDWVRRMLYHVRQKNLWPPKIFSGMFFTSGYYYDYYLEKNGKPGVFKSKTNVNVEKEDFSEEGPIYNKQMLGSTTSVQSNLTIQSEQSDLDIKHRRERIQSFVGKLDGPSLLPKHNLNENPNEDFEEENIKLVQSIENTVDGKNMDQKQRKSKRKKKRKNQDGGLNEIDSNTSELKVKTSNIVIVINEPTDTQVEVTQVERKKKKSRKPRRSRSLGDNINLLTVENDDDMENPKRKSRNKGRKSKRGDSEDDISIVGRRERIQSFANKLEPTAPTRELDDDQVSRSSSSSRHRRKSRKRKENDTKDIYDEMTESKNQARRSEIISFAQKWNTNDSIFLEETPTRKSYKEKSHHRKSSKAVISEKLEFEEFDFKRYSSHRLKISNLPEDITKEDLQPLFRHGEIKVLGQDSSGLSAMVKFDSHERAAKAYNHNRFTKINGRLLELSPVLQSTPWNIPWRKND